MIDATEHWQSTKALSVYNVLVAKQNNDLPLTHIIAVLQSEHLPKYDTDDVMLGVEFLVTRGFVKIEGEVLRAAHVHGPHRPIRLKRTKGDSELELDL